MSGFHTLRVLEVVGEIKDTVSIRFDVPVSLRDQFSWRAGQHVTVRLTVNGEEVRRAYSISTSPILNEPLQITVKRVSRGLVSNHLNDHVKPGDEIDVMPPFGKFCLDPGERLRRTHYFFGAGSGITPLFSMLQSVLRAEPYSVAHLIYGNKQAKTIIFREQLAGLQERHPDRLTVHHVLSNASIWSGFTPWRSGKIDKDAIEALFAECPPYAQDTQYYVCGPGNMNGAVKTALTSLDVPANRVHMESYGGAVDEDVSVTGVPATANVTLDRQTHTIPVAEGQTILHAVRAVGLEPRYSCQSGVCGACRAKLENGQVHMRSRTALEDDDIASGEILTCQSVATSDQISLSYD